MKIGYIGIEDANNANSWSGTLHYLYKYLNKYEEVINLTPLRSEIKLIRIWYKLLSKLFRKKYSYDRNHTLSRKYSMEIDKKIKDLDIDILLSIGSTQIAYLKTNIPIVVYTDATFKSLIDYYEAFSNLSNRTIKEGDLLEKLALDNCNLIFYSSEWAKKSAIYDYNISSDKVYVQPFGLNMDKFIDNDTIKECISKRVKNQTCKLLFVGKDFERKGGDIAYKILRYLGDELKVKTELTIIGCRPNIKDKNVTIINYIDKNNESQSQAYENILLNSDFLILPTRADCTPMVFAEANSYGVPVITTNTGGISSVIDNNINGYMFDFNASYKEYAKYIKRVFEDKNSYINLCLSSRKYFDENTNWDKAVINLIEIIKSNLK